MPPDKTVIGLDIGSNTISCCKMKKTLSGINIINDISLPVRLSEGLRPGGPLLESAIKRALDGLREIDFLFDFAGSQINIAGTAVLRMASNPMDFTFPAEKITGSKINIISGEDEALFTGKGALHELEAGDSPVILDIGGQSTEISTVDKNGIWRAVSMPLGVVSIKEQFLLSPCPESSEIENASFYVKQILDEFFNFNTGKELICVGGTPTTLAMLHSSLNSWSRDRVHGEILNIETVKKWLGIMCQITPETRIEKYGLRPMRADVFPAGLIVLFQIMKYIDTKYVKVSANGLRVGLALSILD
ncbi:MAG: hypothetical protein JXR91_15715 [Deltaproteobacteria bacterium]|nr:hypothetical protein [Deltaproteobacteria bacterium]